MKSGQMDGKDGVQMQIRPSVVHDKGRYLNDVRKIFGILDPLPPLCHAFTQPISTVHPQNWAILEPPLPP